MGLDASIYQNIKPVEMPSIMDSASKAMSLSQMAMQHQQMQRELETQQAMRDAYVNNLDANGTLNQQGLINDVSKVNPMAGMQLGKNYSEMAKQQADTAAAQQDAYQKKASVFAGAMHALSPLSDDQRAQVYPQIISSLKSQGVISPGQKIPDDYNSQWFNSTLAKAQTHMGMNTKDYSDIQKTQAETAKAQADMEKTQSETIKRNPDILGQTNDPAKLVPGYVPKEHQDAAFKEIDAAENTKKMSQSIMDAFDQASNQNTLVKTIGGLRTPPSVLALHQALQPTFKDLEGTVRQAAMDNTFHNVTPAPGDLPSTIATKRKALEGYLQSKASAPTARAYGIDLSKYDSTSAYQSPQKNQNQGGSGNAYAAPMPKTGAIEDGHVFLGGNPADPSRWMKQRTK